MSKKIVIGKPKQESGTIIWPIVIDGTQDEVRTSVSANMCSYIVDDRIDPVVTGLLIFAVRNGYDFWSESPISDELLYNLTYHLIPAISTNSHTPKIEAPTIACIESMGNVVATGISCGVDSLYTVATHTRLPNSTGNLTHLAFFDAGSNHSDKGPSKTKEGRRALAKKFATQNGFEYFEVTSNLPDLIDKYSDRYSHIENHTFMMLHCVLTVAKGIKRYYYSSGHEYQAFNCAYKPDGDFDASHYDLLTLMAASFGNIKFLSTGGDKSRLEKLKLLIDYKPAQEFLNVCVSAVENDNVCFKCVRTMTELDALGAIDRFGSVFDVEYYKSNRKWYLEQVYVGALKGDGFYKDILPYFKAEMSLIFRVKAITKKIISVIKNRL